VHDARPVGGNLYLRWNLGRQDALIGHAFAASRIAHCKASATIASSGDKPFKQSGSGAPSDANAPNSIAYAPEKPSLIDDERATHILDGDATGGGHRGAPASLKRVSFLEVGLTKN